MKIAILADLHLGSRNSNDAIMYHQKKFFDFFFKYIKDNNIDTVLQLGDVFDNRRQTNSKALSFAYLEFFDKLRDNNIKFYSLIGNHCCYYKESCKLSSSSLLLRDFHNIQIISDPTTLEFDGVTFDVIPWICEENKDECLEYMKHTSSDYCLGHFEINNFEVMPNIQFTGGLDENIFAKYKKVFTGHFHQKSDRGHIYYVGTPYQLSWSDVHREKSFVVFDTETRAYFDIVNKDNYHVYLTYDDLNKQFSDIDKLEEHSFVKLIVKNKTEPFLFDSYTRRIYKKNPADVKFIENALITESEQEEIKLTVQTIEDTITNYIRSSNYPNKDALTEYMLMLYNKAMVGDDAA